MRFYITPTVFECDIQDAFVEAHDREIQLYDLFQPDDRIFYISLADSDIEDDAIEAERTGNSDATDRNLVRYLLRQYLPVGSTEAIIVLD